MLSLPETEHQHHELIRPHIDALAAVAEQVAQGSTAAYKDRFEAEYDFVVNQLTPHVEQVEERIYPELERLMQNRHSMAPMRQEHRQIHRLIGALGMHREPVASGTLSAAAATSLRRILYRLYAILKVHLAEEEHYVALLEGNLSPDERSSLARAMEHATAQPL